MSINRTFPGVYVNVSDKSFQTTTTSRFLGGLIGVAERGQFNTPTQVRSLTDYVNKFGRTVPNSYMADAAALISEVSDGLTVVRVGAQYDAVTTGNASGAANTYSVVTPQASLFSVDDYVRITQRGKATTANAKIREIDGTTITLESTGDEAVALADSYTAADIDKSPLPNAANEAEGFVNTLAWSDALQVGAVVLSIDSVKNAYEFTVVGGTASAAISAGDLLKIEEEGKASTREVLVKEVLSDNRVKLETTNKSENGYQALSLQASYSSTGDTVARIYKAVTTTPPPSNPNLVSYASTRSMKITANTQGTWANSDGRVTGVMVRIAPGSSADTKKILVYYQSGLVETIDNVVFDDANSENYAPTRVNGNSAYINVSMIQDVPPANSREPWNLLISENLNVTGLSGGFNGENADVSDYVGTIEPSDDSPTGLKCFEDESVNVNVIAAPGRTEIAIAQEIARVCRSIHAVGVFDIPAELNSREATDWHNGEGLYTGQGRIDSSYIAFFWNWFDTADRFTGQTKRVPPSIGVLLAMARTFDQYKPWYAASGDVRGYIEVATAVEFERLSADAKNAMYGNGNSVNPILKNRQQRIVVFGDRTMQRAESKLTALHNMVLVNEVVRSLAEIGRQFVFDPNDRILLEQIKSRFRTYLTAVKDDRGIEGYDLVLDSSNNTAETRNRREVICDLSIIPTDTMERLSINATVRESGAQLNSVA
jgi:hypothetical protein